MASLKERTDDQRRLQVVVHSVVAALAQLLDKLLHLGLRSLGGLHTGQVLDALHQTVVAFLCGLERIVGEVHRAAVMSREDEEADRHRRIGLLQCGMVASEELLKRDEVTETLTHLLSVDGNHVVVHPVVHHLITLRGYGLRDLAFMVREDQIHATAMDVEVVAEILASHGCALAVPAGIALAPGTGPAHDMLRCSLLPQGEIVLVFLLPHAVELTTIVLDVGEITSGEDAVVVFLVVFLHVEVDRAIALIGETIVHDLLDKFLLLNDMSRCVWLDRRRQHVEHVHGLVIAVGIVLCDLHGLELLQTCFLLDLVVALVGVVLEMAHIGDVAHVANLVA